VPENATSSSALGTSVGGGGAGGGSSAGGEKVTGCVFLRGVVEALDARALAGARFTCFTGTKVKILTQKAGSRFTLAVLVQKCKY
jgi:hypothetical protein